MRAPLSASVLVPILASLCISMVPPTAAQTETAPTSPTTTSTATSGLTDIKSAFDSLRVLPASLDQGKSLKIAIVPLHISYAKRRDTQPYYRDSDFQLSQRDVELLQKTLSETFTNTWFKQQQWEVVTDPATADLKLTVDFKEFWLAAPLKENITVSKTYAEESARFTLSGRIERVSDQQPVVEFSDRRKVKPLGAPPGKVDRFNAVTFWRDMRREMDTAARQLNAAIVSGKNGQKH
jgi:hypothetical protein